MNYLMFIGSFLSIAMVAQGIELVHIETTTFPPPPRPYAFGYAAGRSPGTIDRTHSEISDGNGIVQGSYSYIDPSHKIRTVDYIADKNGFHPTLNFAPTDTAAVAHAKLAHAERYQRIAAAHQQQPHPSVVHLPVDTVAVQRKTQAHHNLYAQIAAEHARIAAERQPLAYEQEQQHY